MKLPLLNPSPALRSISRPEARTLPASDRRSRNV